MSATMTPRTSSEIRLDQAYQQNYQLKPGKHAERDRSNELIAKLREEVMNDPFASSGHGERFATNPANTNTKPRGEHGRRGISTGLNRN